MPLVGQLSSMQEAHFDKAFSQMVSPELPTGRVIDRGGWVKSTPIIANGHHSPFAIRGKYDLLLEFDDDTYGVIDCKFQGQDTDKGDFYLPQLEAYAFALEHPASGPVRTVSVLGLLVWSPIGPTGEPTNGYALRLKSSWRPIKRNTEALAKRLSDFIGVISGPTPERNSRCEHCRYISQRREIFGNE